MSLVVQCFLFILFAQTLLGLANSLFVLSDVNVVLALFGFFGCVAENHYSLICYLFFCSFVSVLMDILRLVLWLPQSGIGITTALVNYYFMLVVFGIVLKIICGVFSLYLIRSMNSREKKSSYQSRFRLEKPILLFLPLRPCSNKKQFTILFRREAFNGDA